MAYSTITKPSDYFNTVTYTGDGNDDRNITGVGFQPDWVWVKERSASRSHRLVDSVRGSSELLFSDQTLAEVTDANEIQAFNSDGFQIGTDVAVNDNSQTYVAWNWLAGGTASSNTQGDITSSVSANTTAGFSIVSYTGNGIDGATVGHGLNDAPDMVIVKSRDAVRNWPVYHRSMGSTNSLKLNLTDAATTSLNPFNGTDPSSSVVTLGVSGGSNGSGENLIMYCFAEKKGFSKAFSYTGNGSTDGPFTYLGFRPAMLLVKRTDSTGNWFIVDNKRDIDNGATQIVLPDSSGAEISSDSGGVLWDLLSNGFKIRSTGAGNNASGGSFIGFAFAENPLVVNTGGGIPATAR